MPPKFDEEVEDENPVEIKLNLKAIGTLLIS